VLSDGAGRRVDTGAVDLHAEDLAFSPGVIWTAINVDYPGHSFSHLGIFHGEAFSAYLRAYPELTAVRGSQWPTAESGLDKLG
jgi:hypothetical protein